MSDVYNNGSCIEHNAYYPCKICFPHKPREILQGEIEALEEKLRVAVEALMYLQTKGCSPDNCAYKCDLAKEALAKIKGDVNE